MVDVKVWDDLWKKGSSFWEYKVFNGNIPKKSLSFWQTLWYEYMFNKRVDFIKERTPKKGKVIELGCGSGIYGRIFSKDYNLYLLDISKKSLELTKNIVKKATFVNADLMKTPFKKDFFDTIYSLGVIEHLDDPIGAVKEMKRIAKKGGRVIIGVPNKFSAYYVMYLILTILGKLIGIKLWPYGYESMMSLSKVKKLGKSAGLKLESYDIFFGGDFYYFMKYLSWVPFKGVLLRIAGFFDRLTKPFNRFIMVSFVKN